MSLFLAAALFLLSGLADQPGRFTVESVKSSALDANGKPEVHLIMTGLRAPATGLRIVTDRAKYDIPWAWTGRRAEVWLAVGEWRRLVVFVTYADGTHDSASLGKWENTDANVQ